MAEKYVNYVNTADGRDLLDLRHDSVKPEFLLLGETAHDATGKPIVGALKVDEGVIESGQCGESATWSFYSDGTLVINGSGAIDADYVESEDVDWLHLENQVNKIIIYEGITDTGNHTFMLFKENLGSVLLPNSLITIGKQAFKGCNKISSISIPNKVTDIGEGAFERCESLSNITIPNSVVSIQKDAFYNCTSLENVLIGNNVTDIGAAAFQKTAINHITFPDSVVLIGDDAFADNFNLEKVTFGKGTNILFPYIFGGSLALNCVFIPDTVTEIQAGIFSIYDEAAGGWITPNIAKIYYSGTKEQWDSIIVGEHNEWTESADLHCEYDPNADTVDGWNIDVRLDGSDPDDTTKPTISFIFSEG